MIICDEKEELFTLLLESPFGTAISPSLRPCRSDTIMRATPAPFHEAVIAPELVVMLNADGASSSTLVTVVRAFQIDVGFGPDALDWKVTVMESVPSSMRW